LLFKSIVCKNKVVEICHHNNACNFKKINNNKHQCMQDCDPPSAPAQLGLRGEAEAGHRQVPEERAAQEDQHNIPRFFTHDKKF
jgi:hypothetical protein